MTSAISGLQHNENVKHSLCTSKAGSEWRRAICRDGLSCTHSRSPRLLSISVIDHQPNPHLPPQSATCFSQTVLHRSFCFKRCGAEPLANPVILTWLCLAARNENPHLLSQFHGNFCQVLITTGSSLMDYNLHPQTQSILALNPISHVFFLQ